MTLFVNARFLTQPLSGVQRYGIECSRQIKKLLPEAVFIAPRNVLHVDIAKELNVKMMGRNTGQKWEQLDLPFYLARHKSPPLLNLANSAPILYSNNYVTIHDLAFYHHPEWNSRSFAMWYNIMIPRLALRSRHIFTVSETVKQELIRCYNLPPARISVAYNGVSRRMMEMGAGGGKKERIILSVGTFNIRKNHAKLLEAFLASRLCDTYKLVMIGDRNRIFKESGLDEQSLNHPNIEVQATMTEDELIATYRKAEIVVSLSLYEGFGIPLLEGIFNGCKIVCSDIPVYREIYGDVATFCDPLNVPDIIAALESATNIPRNEFDISGLMKKYNYAVSAHLMVAKVLSGGK